MKMQELKMKQTQLVKILIILLLLSISFAHEPGMSAINFYYNNDSFIVRVYGHASKFGENYEAGVKEKFKLELDGKVRILEPDKVLFNAMGDWVTWEASLDVLPREITVKQRLFVDEAASYTIISVLQNDNLMEQVSLREDGASFHYSYSQAKRSLGSWAHHLYGFLLEGIKHIFTGPDHILFLLGLLLLGGRTKQLVKVITAFTVAHALTFWLAALNIFNPPAFLVEPIIALSVVVAALANLRPNASDKDLRPGIAFGFGLIHGFGFAGLLANLGLEQGSLLLSFIAFAAGLELGQLMIAFVVVPVLAYLALHRVKLRNQVKWLGSLGIAAIGAYWFVERVMPTVTTALTAM